MALVKTSDIVSSNGKANGRGPEKPGLWTETSSTRTERAAAAAPRKSLSNGDAQRRRQRTFGRQQKAAERVASAAVQVASGIAEAASACEELTKAMEQISTGAEEAASAAEESQRAVTRIVASIQDSAQSAEASLHKAEALQNLLGSVSTQVVASIASVSRAAELQTGSVAMVAKLDEQAANIGDIVKAVARIADQTNLLALNAAIEAARAGQHGKGFAVVADEVRTLAETSEKSARDIQELVGQIQTEVKVIAEGINASAEAARAEARTGETVTSQLGELGHSMANIRRNSQEILKAAQESDVAAKEAQKGAEAISAAAQEQSAACEEAVKTVEQQTSALSQSEQAASELSELAEELKNSTDIAKSAEEVASASEELSSAVEEINRAAAQIMTAIEQINRGAQQQGAATQQSSAAIAQMEQGAQIATQRAARALEQVETMTALLGESRVSIDQMIAGVQSAVEVNARSREQVNALEQVSRRIDKIVDAITTVSIQTNMLAVNGSIEAARAGEFGKGFMVVSTDIRNLARDSSENADQIKDLVKAVQDQIVAVRRDLEETAQLASAEVEKNKLITTTLTSAEAEMLAVRDGNEQVNRGAAAILEALSESKRGVDQVSAAAAQSSAAANQAAQATREQAKGAEELASAVEEIASLADELQNSEAA